MKKKRERGRNFITQRAQVKRVHDNEKHDDKLI